MPAAWDTSAARTVTAEGRRGRRAGLCSARQEEPGEVAPGVWDDLWRTNPEGAWRLVRFEAEHEPDRVAHFEALEDIERERRRELRRQRATAMLPLDRRGPYALPLELALDRLEGVRPAGPGRWKARCPLHDDASPSLYVTEQEARPGEAVLHCFAGCDWRNVKAALRGPE